MSATLAGANAFTYRSVSTVEVPAKTGQFITLFSTVEIALKRPDRLRAQLSGEAPQFDFFFDGTTASAYAPATNVYSTVQTPPTIDAMLPALEQETGIRIVSAPLLVSDPYAMLTRDLSSGAVVGPTVINGRPVRAPCISVTRNQLGNLTYSIAGRRRPSVDTDGESFLGGLAHSPL
jgi:hypothetical protein